MYIRKILRKKKTKWESHITCLPINEINYGIAKIEATWEWIYSGLSEVEHCSRDGQGLSVKRRHGCPEGSVRGGHLLPDLLTRTGFSLRCRIQSMHRGRATCSRAQKYLLGHLVCVIYSVSAILRWPWLAFSVIISDSFSQMKTTVLILHAFETVFKMSGLCCLCFEFPPFLQFLVSISLSTEDFNCCYLSVCAPSMKVQCLRALVALRGRWVLCLSKQISQ